MSRKIRIASALGITTLILGLTASPSQAQTAFVDSAITSVQKPIIQRVVTEAKVAAAAQTVYPNPGEGMIAITSRICGSASGWEVNAALNDVTPPVYLVRLGQQLNIQCGLSAPLAAPVVAPAAPAPAAPAAAGGLSPAVAGLSQQQSDNARIIVQVAKIMGLGRQAMVIALATALQECGLYNLANGNVPESYNYPNQGTGWDHDSVGLFQQRPGWGSVAERMNPWYSASAFYNALLRFDYWDYPVTVAAQKVQVSAYPDAYAKHVPLASAIVDALL
jgi:hypothetical protein